jgi:phosphoserine aminotransferase
MSTSAKLRIFAVVVLIVLAVFDGIAFYIPIVAIVGIALLLFRPAWLFKFIAKVFDKRGNFNFSAGPAVLPVPVLLKAREELFDYRGSGMSVMEMSHRSPLFADIITRAEGLLRDIMSIPDEYAVLFLQGGASTQFAMVPLNLLNRNGRAVYIDTGNWSKKAISEAKRYGEVVVLASSEYSGYTTIPDIDMGSCPSDADYFHITTNNTIYGTRFTVIPDPGPSIPLVADMSSNILSQRYDVTRFGLIYAGAQKNIGPAGLTIVILRRDLIGRAREAVPTMLDYKTHADRNSVYNTPPCWSIYMAMLMFEWVQERGGVTALEKNNERKAAILYDFLDRSRLFTATVAKKDRSLMNVPFTLPSEELTSLCLREAEGQGLVNLKGHRSVGGLRASLFNAMPLKGVERLVEFLSEFERKNG